MEKTKFDEDSRNHEKEEENIQTLVDIAGAYNEIEIQNVLPLSDPNEPIPSSSSTMAESNLVISLNSDLAQQSPSFSQEALSHSQDCATDHESRNESHIHSDLDAISVGSSDSYVLNIFDDMSPSPMHDPSNNIALPRPENQAGTLPAFSQALPIVSIPNHSIIQALQSRGPPPSYSKCLLDHRIDACGSIQFVAPIPPPSYDGADNQLRIAPQHSFTLGLGDTWQSQPQFAFCQVCGIVTITQIDARVSKTAHLIALVMFFLLCWPFCLLPYFLTSCYFTNHYCSVCHSYLGTRRPFQRT